MPDLRELYQDTILDHNKKPRNFREIADASAKAVGHNPQCGGRVTGHLRLADGPIGVDGVGRAPRPGPLGPSTRLPCAPPARVTRLPPCSHRPADPRPTT